MESLQLDISSLSDLDTASKDLLQFANGIKVFCFEAEMGEGKTTFIKHLCKVLGSNDNFSSPTYSIVNEYASPNGKIFHFDLYRLKSENELYDLGFEEYIGSGNYCFIEWPEIARAFLPNRFMTIFIRQNQNKRYISAQING